VALAGRGVCAGGAGVETGATGAGSLCPATNPGRNCKDVLEAVAANNGLESPGEYSPVEDSPKNSDATITYGDEKYELGRISGKTDINQLGNDILKDVADGKPKELLLQSGKDSITVGDTSPQPSLSNPTGKTTLDNAGGTLGKTTTTDDVADAAKQDNMQSTPTCNSNKCSNDSNMVCSVDSDCPRCISNMCSNMKMGCSWDFECQPICNSGSCSTNPWKYCVQNSDCQPKCNSNICSTNSAKSCTLDSDCPTMRRLTQESSPGCTRSERNTFSLINGFQRIVTRCLTLGGSQDNHSDILTCMADIVANDFGVSQMTFSCYECLIDGVETINQISSRTVRDACISNLSSNACASVDLSAFISCTNGYDPRKSVVESYCSATNALDFTKNEVYRSITTACLTPAADGAATGGSLTDCIVSSIVSLIGDSAASTIEPQCIICWYNLFAAMAILPPSQKAACVADPTSNTCVSDSFHKDLVLFSKCSGINAVATDLTYLSQNMNDQANNSSAMRSVFVATTLILSAALLF